MTGPVRNAWWRMIFILPVLTGHWKETVLAQEYQPPSGIAARWVAGRAWRVEYLTTTPSEAKYPAAPSQQDRSLWNYQVVRAENGFVVLSVAEESGDRTYEATFDWTGPRLRRVVRISGAMRDPIIDVNPAGAYTGWELRHQTIFDWPWFPIGAGQKHEFDVASLHVVETAAGSGDRLQTSMDYTDKRSDSYAEARRVVQTWDSASPWWLSASIEVEYTISGQKSQEVLIEGRLIR